MAYLRFASVYRNFSSVADFEAEIADLRGRMSPEDAPGSGAGAETAGASGADGTDERSGGEDAVGGDRSGTSMPGRGEASPAHASTRG